MRWHRKEGGDTMKIPIVEGMANSTFGAVRSRLPWWKRLFHRHKWDIRKAEDDSWLSVYCWCGAGQSWQG